MDTLINGINGVLAQLFGLLSIPAWLAALVLLLLAAAVLILLVFVARHQRYIERTNRELLLANRRLSLATSVAGVGIWEWEKETDQLLWNPVMYRIYGVPPERRLSIDSLRAWILPDDWQRMKALFQSGLSSGRNELTFSIIRDDDGSMRHLHATCHWVHTGRRHRLIGTQVDITEEHTARQQIYREAYQDALTGLPNSRALRMQLHAGLQQARQQGLMQGVFFIDLDGFKKVNDTLGHDIGDLLLKGAAGRMRQVLRQTDHVYRLGGDEFVVWIAHLRQDEITVLETIASKLIETLSQPFQFGEVECRVSASVGIATSPDDADELEALLKAADVAMYQAKKGGKNQFRRFQAGTTVEQQMGA